MKKKTPIFSESTSGQLGGPDDSQSMGNRLLGYAGDIPGINLPDRVQLATELGHFVGGLPSDPAETGVVTQVGQIVRKSIENTVKIH